MDTDKEKCAQMVNDIATKIDEIATKPVTEGKTKIIKMLEVELKNKNNELFSASSPANKDNLTSEIKQLSEALTQYKVSNNDKFSSITILEKAAASEKKTKPVRWLIVTLSILGGFFFSLLAAVVVNQISYIRKSL
jgi:LPS O-antigen subunit length determinant protein (WzzB/FepE family)